MKKRFILFLAVQLIWSVFACVMTLIKGRNSADKAPESLFILGGVVIWTILFIALQPLIMCHKASNKARLILVISYIFMFVASCELFKNSLIFFAICSFILSISGMLTYSVTDEGLSAHLSRNTYAKAVFFLQITLSLMCNVCGNIALIFNSDSNKSLNIIMILLIIVASIVLLLFKNKSMGIIHLCTLVISGLQFEAPLMYILLLLLFAEILTIHGKFSIYTSG